MVSTSKIRKGRNKTYRSEREDRLLKVTQAGNAFIVNLLTNILEKRVEWFEALSFEERTKHMLFDFRATTGAELVLLSTLGLQGAD
jgi:hypothetical protein